MSTTHEVVSGDTFELIARKVYGTELEALRIAQANPGAAEPLTAGISLNVPSLQGAPLDAAANAVSDVVNETAIIIDGQRFRFWSTISIIRSMDSMDIAEFTAPFDADAPGFREAFQPFSYKPFVVTVGGDPLFRGSMVSVSPLVEPGSKTLAVSGYALPGVLNDCTAPASSYPIEFDDQGLREIALSLAAPFGIDVVFDAEQGAVFERVAIDPSRKLLGFLADLAQQRNLIISSDADGALLFQQSVAPGNPVAVLKQGDAPLVSVTPFFRPQEYYSHITGIEPTIVGLAGAQFTVKNERLTGVIRPLAFTVADTLDADVKTAVAAKVGRMFGNMAGYTIEVAAWRDSQGKLWQPNTTLKLLAPDAMVYSAYEFIIRTVEFRREPRAEIAILNLVVPGAFSGEVPEALPWD